MVRGEVDILFGGGSCIIMVCKPEVGGDDKLSEGIQGRFVVNVIWCSLVGGEEG